MTAGIPVLEETKRMTGMGISLGAITPGQGSWTALLALQQQKMVNSSSFNSSECHLLICFCLSSGFEYADSANKIDFGNNGKAGVIFLLSCLSCLMLALAWTAAVGHRARVAVTGRLFLLYQVNYLPLDLLCSSPKLMGARTQNNTQSSFLAA